MILGSWGQALALRPSPWLSPLLGASYALETIQTDRPTDRETNTPKDRQLDRQRDRQLDKPKERQTDRPTDRQTDSPTDQNINRLIYEWLAHKIRKCEYVISLNYYMMNENNNLGMSIQRLWKTIQINWFWRSDRSMLRVEKPPKPLAS